MYEICMIVYQFYRKNGHNNMLYLFSETGETFEYGNHHFDLEGRSYKLSKKVPNLYSFIHYTV